MLCPACSHKLTSMPITSYSIDFCQHCKGMWLDKGELSNLVQEFLQFGEIKKKPFHPYEKTPITQVEQGDKQIRQCPRCAVAMETFNYAYDSNVLLEKCNPCQGVWADAGEVSKVAEHLKDNPSISAVGESLLALQAETQVLKDFGELGEELTAPVNIFYIPRIILPLADDTERIRIPWATCALILLTVVTSLCALSLFKEQTTLLQYLVYVPENFWRIGLITSLFMHGSVWHLLGNMFFLWLFGDNVEDQLGHLGSVVFYLCSGIFALLVHSVTTQHSGVPVVGASGAVSGIMGAYFVFYPSARIHTLMISKIVSVPAYIYLGGWFALQLFYACFFQMAGYSNVAWFAHVGGFLFGCSVAYAWRLMWIKGSMHKS